MEVMEKRTRKLSSCQISASMIKDIASAIHRGGIETVKQLLGELGPEPPESMEKEGIEKMVRWRFEKESIEKVASLSVTIESGKRTAQFSSIGALAKLELPADLQEIIIEGGRTYSEKYYCRLRFSVRSHPELSSEYSLQGRDPLTLNGVAKTLDELLDERETKDHLAYELPYTLLASAAIGFLACWAILRIITLLTRTQFTTPLPLLAGIFALLTFVIAWSSVEHLLQWLFPYFSYSEDKRNKRRSIVKGIF